MTESVNNSSVSPNYVTDAAGHVYTLVPSANAGSQIFYNGAVDLSTSFVALLLYFNHGLYYQSAAGNWFIFKNPGWVWTSSDPRLVLVESTDGSTVTSLGPMLVDSSLERWTLIPSLMSGMQIAVNGVRDAVTDQVTLMVYKTHRVYQQNSWGDWWYKAKSTDAWVKASDPRIGSTPAPTPTPAPTVTPTPTPAATVTHYGTSAPSLAPVGWPIRFFDDFTSFNPSATAPTAATDAASNWALNVQPGTYHLNGASEQEYYCSPGHNGINPFTQTGSILSVTARKPTSTEATHLGGYQYISGALATYNFLTVTGGYFELNAKLPVGTGMWAAFWLACPSGVWPPEFDILEQFGSTPSAMWTTIHSGSGDTAKAHKTVQTGVNLQTGFHTYGGLWTPNYMAAYFDGVLQFSTTVGLGGGTNQFNASNPMSLIVNFALGTGLGDQPAVDAALPASLQIDWVRVSALGPQ